MNCYQCELRKFSSSLDSQLAWWLVEFVFLAAAAAPTSYIYRQNRMDMKVRKLIIFLLISRGKCDVKYIFRLALKLIHFTWDRFAHVVYIRSKKGRRTYQYSRVRATHIFLLPCTHESWREKRGKSYRWRKRARGRVTVQRAARREKIIFGKETTAESGEGEEERGWKAKHIKKNRTLRAHRQESLLSLSPCTYKITSYVEKDVHKFFRQDMFEILGDIFGGSSLSVCCQHISSFLLALWPRVFLGQPHRDRIDYFPLTS